LHTGGVRRTCDGDELDATTVVAEIGRRRRGGSDDCEPKHA
jgi:hypothetical protein